MVVVGSERADFPGQTESLLLSVAANQVSIGLREAGLLGEQKRIANELDRRVAERTAELAAANEELRKEIAERKLAEERLRHEERELKRSESYKAAIVDSSADCVVAMDHEGRITEFNPQRNRPSVIRGVMCWAGILPRSSSRPRSATNTIGGSPAIWPLATRKYWAGDLR